MAERPSCDDLLHELRLLAEHGERANIVSAARQLCDHGVTDPRVVAMAATDRDVADISYRARVRQFANFLAEVDRIEPGSVVIEGPPPAELVPPPPPGTYPPYEPGTWDARVAQGRVAKLTVTVALEATRWHQSLVFESAAGVHSAKIPPQQSVTVVLDDLAGHGWRTTQVVVERASIAHDPDHGEVSYPVATAYHLERHLPDGFTP